MNKSPCGPDSGLMRVPPFRDAHTHFTRNGVALSLSELRQLACRLLSSGVFLVYDCGFQGGPGLTAKGILAATAGARLSVKSCGRALYKAGGYGSFLGIGVSSAEESVTAIHELAGQGADFIKVINSGIVSPAAEGFVTPGGFTPEELRVIVSEAGGLGLPVHCHADGDAAIRSAVAAGVSSVEHGFFVCEDTLRLMADQGTQWTPTAAALLAVTAFVPDKDKPFIEETVQRHLASIAFADAIGVRLTVGTDSGSRGVTHGVSFFEELRLFKKAGLSMERILRAACMETVEMEQGNFLLVAQDFIDTGRVEAVFCAGKQIPGLLRA